MKILYSCTLKASYDNVNHAPYLPERYKACRNSWKFSQPSHKKPSRDKLRYQKLDLHASEIFSLWSFSSYKTQKDLREVLSKYGIDTSNDIKKIPSFVPGKLGVMNMLLLRISLTRFFIEPVKIDNDDEELEQCITEIKRRMVS